jgi:hypothetical protein
MMDHHDCWVFIYLFIYSLFNDAVVNSDYMTSNNWVTMNNEFERIWKVAVMTLREVPGLHQHPAGE